MKLRPIQVQLLYESLIWVVVTQPTIDNSSKKKKAMETFRFTWSFQLKRVRRDGGGHGEAGVDEVEQKNQEEGEQQEEEEGNAAREDRDMVNLIHRGGCDFAHWVCCQYPQKMPPGWPI